MAESGEQHRRNTSGLRPPWKKGQSGNPGGRPKGTGSPLATLRRVLAEEGEPALERVIRNMLKQAESDDQRALGWVKELFDRLDGAVVRKQQLDVTGDKVKVVRLAGDEDDEDPGAGEDGGEVDGV